MAEKVKADGWKENMSGTCCVNWVVSSMLVKDGEAIKVQQDLRADEEVIEQECGTGRGTAELWAISSWVSVSVM